MGNIQQVDKIIATYVFMLKVNTLGLWIIDTSQWLQ